MDGKVPVNRVAANPSYARSVASGPLIPSREILARNGVFWKVMSWKRIASRKKTASFVNSYFSLDQFTIFLLELPSETSGGLPCPEPEEEALSATSARSARMIGLGRMHPCRGIEEP